MWYIPHPADDVLEMYCRGELSTRRRSEIQDHLSSCERCAKAVDVIREFSATVRAAFEELETVVRTGENRQWKDAQSK